MARIQTRKGKNRTTFAATVRVSGFDTCTRTFDTKGEAKTWAANIEREMRMGRYQDIRPVKKITLSEAMERIFMPVKISQMQENRMIHNAVQLIFRGGSILVYGQ